MMTALRRIGAVIAGLIVAIIVVQLAEMLVHAMHPFPPGLDQHDMAAIKKFVATLPLSALLLVLAGWFLGTILGTFTAAKIAAMRMAAYITGAILLCLGIANAFIIPQPLWFSAASVVVYVGGTVMGAASAASLTERSVP